MIIRGVHIDLHSITVEPVMVIYMYTTFASFLTFQSLVYDKVCAEKFNSTVCFYLENKTFKDEEDMVQKESSMWILYNNLLMGVPSLFTVILFLGPWGDKVGRKVPVIIPLIGSTLAATGNLLNSIFMSAPLAYLFFGNFLNGVMGGFVAALMSMYSYVAAISSPKSKTIRIGILEGMIFLAGFLGTGTNGIMLDNTSYIFVFSLLIGLNALAILYAVVWLENVVPEQSSVLESTDKDNCSRFLLSAAKDVGLCVYEKRKSKDFFSLFLLIIVIFCLMLVTVGENDIILIFTRHPPLNWSQTTLGFYKGTETFLRGFAVLLFLPIVKKKINARDTTVGIIGLISKTAALVVLGVGRQTPILFIGAVSGILQGFSSAAVRSMCSSLVANNEQAKVFSLIAFAESISTIVATSLFNTVYNATLDFYHGFCFLMASIFTGSCVLIMLFLHCRQSDQDTNVYATLQEDVHVDVSLKEEPHSDIAGSSGITDEVNH